MDQIDYYAFGERWISRRSRVSHETEVNGHWDDQYHCEDKARFQVGERKSEEEEKQDKAVDNQNYSDPHIK
jgi:hypothetical protein